LGAGQFTTLQAHSWDAERLFQEIIVVVEIHRPHTVPYRQSWKNRVNTNKTNQVFKVWFDAPQISCSNFPRTPFLQVVIRTPLPDSSLSPKGWWPSSEGPQKKIKKVLITALGEAPVIKWKEIVVGSRPGPQVLFRDRAGYGTGFGPKKWRKR